MKAHINQIIATSLLVAFVIITISILAGCKSRKVITDKSSVTKSISSEQNRTYNNTDSVTSIDTGKKTSVTQSEVNSTSSHDTEFTADSAVTTTLPDGTTKTTFYTGGGKVKIHGQTAATKKENKTTDVKSGKSQVAIQNYAGTSNNKSNAKTDSTNLHSDVQSKGSAVTWAYTIPIVIGLVVAIALFFIYKYFKK